jgi:hypothetical protein
MYPTEATATAAGATLGQLTAANVHMNLTGQNHPTAVVGSSDGWLYGFNPCNVSIDFAVNFGTPVGEATFGDTDGDGLDEILTTTADGYLYDLKNDSIAAPSYVWDIDPDHGITNHDVDSIVTTNKLSGTWASVNGSTAYEVAIVDSKSQIISVPAWQNVGTKVSASVTGLPLQDGQKYFFAVRAVGPQGVSVDAESNGVVVHFPGDAGAPDSGPPRDASADVSADVSPDVTVTVDGSSEGGGQQEMGGGGGCGCRLASRGTSSMGTLGGLGLLLGFALRRRGRAGPSARRDD